jgi:hypothetical protein
MLYLEQPIFVYNFLFILVAFNNFKEIHMTIDNTQKLLHLQLYFTNVNEIVKFESGLESHSLFTDV